MAAGELNDFRTLYIMTITCVIDQKVNAWNLLCHKWVIKYLGDRIDWVSEMEPTGDEILWGWYLQSQ